jgi:hypothetical protein
MAVEEDQYEKDGFHPLHEAKLLINIALPTVIVQFECLLSLSSNSLGCGSQSGDARIGRVFVGKFNWKHDLFGHDYRCLISG